MEKSYTKTKIFLFLVFAMVALALISQVVRLMQDGLFTISKKSTELKCNDLNFQIKSMGYEDQRFIFEVISSDYDTNITKITLVSSNEEYTQQLLPPLKGGESRFLRFDNITLEEVYVFAEDCRDNGKEVKK